MFQKGVVGFGQQLLLALAMLAVMAGAAMASGPTFATTEVTDAITAAATAVGVIGAAIVAGPKVVKAAWGWIRGVVR